MSILCRDCGHEARIDKPTARCPECASRRLLAHPELDMLDIAHLDCDAFYASVEKRDNPDLAERPVIVGGGRRGVVAAACYIARTYGVRSAMPMFKALKACPDAVVIRPDMAKYSSVGREVRTLMRHATPLVEPISVDEAFLDLTGTRRLHGGSPARTMASLVRRIASEIGIPASIGLSYNKFLAKIASDLDKPRGFAVIGRAEAVEFLAGREVGLIWGVGQALRKRLLADGITRIGQLQIMDESGLVARYGSIGRRLARFSRGIDDRHVEPHADTKSVSAETTFDQDITGADRLARLLWPLCERVARRLKSTGLAGQTVTLKLKTANFRLRTRARTMDTPTQLAEVIYRAAAPLLEKEADGTSYRLIGVGTSRLSPAADADPPDLLDPDAMRRAKVERAIDDVRARLGQDAIGKGRGFPIGGR